MIGFISHVDTSPDMNGANIRPQILTDYAGKDIRLNENLVMTVTDFPELAFFKGLTLITTDGTSLLLSLIHIYFEFCQSLCDWKDDCRQSVYEWGRAGRKNYPLR